MVRMATVKPPKPYKIEKFLGINEAVGETEIKIGESVEMQNFRVTKNMKLQKREGYRSIVDFKTDKPIRGIWEGILNGQEVVIAINDGKLYQFNKEEFTNG